MNRRQFLIAGATLAAASPFAGAARAQGVTARVGYIPIVGTAPFFVANGEGWLKQGGIETAITVFESGPNMIQALASGTIDIYVAGVAPLAIASGPGAGSQNDIGTSVLGGMISATVLAIFLVSVFFVVVRLFFRRRSASSGDALPGPSREGA